MRRIAVLAGFLAAAFWSGGGTGAAWAQAGTPIAIGTSLSQTPWGFHDNAGNPTGIDVSLCGAIAKAMDRTPSFVDLDFKGLIPALGAQRFDMICAAVYITPEREQVATFIPYIQTSQAILAKAGSPIHGLADLCGHTASVLQGSLQQKTLEDQSAACRADGKSAVDIRSFDTQPVAARALENGNVDVFVATDQLVSFYQLNSSGLVKVASGIKPTTLGIAVRKDDGKLADAIRAALDRIRKDGTYDAVLKQWGVQSAALP